MRITWINHRDILHPRSGGAERTIYEVSRRLVSRGHVVTWVSIGPTLVPGEAKLDGIRLVRFPSIVGGHLQVPVHIRDLASDEIVIEDLAHVLPWMTRFFQRGTVITFFRHLHRRTLPGQVGRLLALPLSALELTYPLIYKGQQFVTESMSSERDLRGLGIPADLITRIPPGVDTGLFHPTTPVASPQIVYFGGLRDYKRPDVVLALIARLLPRFPNLKCVVIGDGPALPRLIKATKELGLGSSVEFTGRLPIGALARRVAESWLNVHFSVAEGWCLSAMEAASCGVPTVGYRVYGLQDSVSEGRSGVLVRDESLTDLAEAASRVLRNVDYWRQTARAYATAFDWETTTDRWIECLASQQ